jgi:hypothetical protein
MRLVRTLAALAGLSLAAFSAHAATFTAGEFVTWSQVAWGADPYPGDISFSLEQNFASLFAPSGLLQVGIPDPGFSLIFDSADAVIAYLPADGTPGPLTVTLLDPVTSASGVLGGEVVVATLNVPFSDDGLIAHPPGVAFGDLIFHNLDLLGAAELAPDVGPEIADLDGMSVREVLSEADQMLGGEASSVTPSDMFTLLDFTARAFNGGNLLSDADTFLAFPPSTAPTVPEPSPWAMLLIGFAGLGLARYRTSRSIKVIEGSSALPQGGG